MMVIMPAPPLAPPASEVMHAADVVDALACAWLPMPNRWGLDLGNAALAIARPDRRVLTQPH